MYIFFAVSIKKLKGCYTRNAMCRVTYKKNNGVKRICARNTDEIKK